MTAPARFVDLRAYVLTSLRDAGYEWDRVEMDVVPPEPSRKEGLFVLAFDAAGRLIDGDVPLDRGAIQAWLDADRSAFHWTMVAVIVHADGELTVHEGLDYVSYRAAEIMRNMPDKSDVWRSAFVGARCRGTDLVDVRWGAQIEGERFPRFYLTPESMVQFLEPIRTRLTPECAALFLSVEPDGRFRVSVSIDDDVRPSGWRELPSEDDLLQEFVRHVHDAAPHTRSGYVELHLGAGCEPYFKHTNGEPPEDGGFSEVAWGSVYYGTHTLELVSRRFGDTFPESFKLCWRDAERPDLQLHDHDAELVAVELVDLLRAVDTDRGGSDHEGDEFGGAMLRATFEAAEDGIWLGEASVDVVAGHSLRRSRLPEALRAAVEQTRSKLSCVWFDMRLFNSEPVVNFGLSPRVHPDERAPLLRVGRWDHMLDSAFDARVEEVEVDPSISINVPKEEPEADASGSIEVSTNEGSTEGLDREASAPVDPAVDAAQSLLSELMRGNTDVSADELVERAARLAPGVAWELGHEARSASRLVVRSAGNRVCVDALARANDGELDLASVVRSIDRVVPVVAELVTAAATAVLAFAKRGGSIPYTEDWLRDWEATHVTAREALVYHASRKLEALCNEEKIDGLRLAACLNDLIVFAPEPPRGLPELFLRCEETEALIATGIAFARRTSTVEPLIEALIRTRSRDHGKTSRAQLERELPELGLAVAEALAARHRHLRSIDAEFHDLHCVERTLLGVVTELTLSAPVLEEIGAIVRNTEGWRRVDAVERLLELGALERAGFDVTWVLKALAGADPAWDSADDRTLIGYVARHEGPVPADELVRQLTRHLESQGGDTRAFAALALARHPACLHDGVVSALARHLGDRAPAARLASAVALWRLQMHGVSIEDARAMLVKLADQGAVPASSVAAVVLGRLDRDDPRGAKRTLRYRGWRDAIDVPADTPALELVAEDVPTLRAHARDLLVDALRANPDRAGEVRAALEEAPPSLDEARPYVAAVERALSALRGERA